MSVKGFSSLGTYCLIPRETKTGLTYITRAEWEDWFGKEVAVDERRVSGWFADKWEAVPWCVQYAKEHPGCVAHHDLSAVRAGVGDEKETAG